MYVFIYVYDHKTWHSRTKKLESRNAMQTRSKLRFERKYN